MDKPWLREDFWLGHKFELNASDLLSRSGFLDGNLFDEMLGDHGYEHSVDEKYTGDFDSEGELNNTYHLVLIEVGRQVLFPVLEAYGFTSDQPLGKMYTHCTSHNPLRCEGYWEEYFEIRAKNPAFFGIKVVITGADVLKIAHEIYPRDLRKDYIV